MNEASSLLLVASFGQFQSTDTTCLFLSSFGHRTRHARLTFPKHLPASLVSSPYTSPVSSAPSYLLLACQCCGLSHLHSCAHIPRRTYVIAERMVFSLLLSRAIRLRVRIRIAKQLKHAPFAWWRTTVRHPGRPPPLPPPPPNHFSLVFVIWFSLRVFFASLGLPMLGSRAGFVLCSGFQRPNHGTSFAGLRAMSINLPFLYAMYPFSPSSTWMLCCPCLATTRLLSGLLSGFAGGRLHYAALYFPNPIRTTRTLCGSLPNFVLHFFDHF